MKQLIKIIAISIALLTPMAAHAATLSLVGGQSGVTLPSNFSGASHLQLTGLQANVDQVTVFNSTNTNEGLALSGPATVRFDYLGKEAGYINKAIELAGFGILFSTDSDLPGTSSVTVSLTPNANGLLPFKFTTSGGGGQEAENGNIDNPLAIAFSALSNDGRSIIALFGDGAGDHDFDDMAIRISVVPLPPALLLFGGALLGLGWLGRRKNQV
ncbi:hypothetical protein [Sneathiella sp.]|jgi:hypothetical protein|uniref:hypothetical protein n=1 Tax=Sneathiella sp. TaxID=1964365 RepID=UPI0039E51960